MVDPVTRLLAIEDIKTLRAQYWRFVDTKKWPEFAELWAPNATFEDHASGFRTESGPDFAEKVAQVFQPQVLTVHHGHQHEIVIVDEDHATGIWAMEDYLVFPEGTAYPGAPEIGKVRGYGHYWDEYVRVDGRWLFAKVDLYRLRLESESASATVYPTVSDAVPAATR
jgi:hypothetical protein